MIEPPSAEIIQSREEDAAPVDFPGWEPSAEVEDADAEGEAEEVEEGGMEVDGQ